MLLVSGDIWDKKVVFDIFVNRVGIGVHILIPSSNFCVMF